MSFSAELRSSTLRTSRSSRRALGDAGSAAPASARNARKAGLKIESRGSGVSGTASVVMRTVRRTAPPERAANETVLPPTCIRVARGSARISSARWLRPSSDGRSSRAAHTAAVQPPDSRG